MLFVLIVADTCPDGKEDFKHSGKTQILQTPQRPNEKLGFRHKHCNKRLHKGIGDRSVALHQKKPPGFAFQLVAHHYTTLDTPHLPVALISRPIRPVRTRLLALPDCRIEQQLLPACKHRNLGAGRTPVHTPPGSEHIRPKTGQPLGTHSAFLQNYPDFSSERSKKH